MTEKKDLSVSLGTLALPLKEVQVAGSFAGGTPPESITNGMLYGFLTQAAADAALLPKSTPNLGPLVRPGDPLSKLLREQDQAELNGEKGWWFVVSYTAKTQAFEP